jgi:signal peptidase II
LNGEPARRVGRRGRLLVTVGAALVVLCADQVTKTLAVDHLSGHSVHLFGPFSLVLSYNSGVAFSIGTGLTLPIVLIVVVLILAVAWFGRGIPTWPGAIALGLILGGAIGNLSDRLFRGHHGAVVDFLASTFWPTFNVADSCIVCGSFLLAFEIVRLGRRPPATEVGRSSENGPDHRATSGGDRP